jgi:hypothetical protein
LIKLKVRSTPVWRLGETIQRVEPGQLSRSLAQPFEWGQQTLIPREGSA